MTETWDVEDVKVLKLPDGHKAIDLAQAHGGVWCLVERPDGGSYWIPIETDPTEH